MYPWITVSKTVGCWRVLRTDELMEPKYWRARSFNSPAGSLAVSTFLRPAVRALGTGRFLIMREKINCLGFLSRHGERVAKGRWR